MASELAPPHSMTLHPSHESLGLVLVADSSASLQPLAAAAAAAADVDDVDDGQSMVCHPPRPELHLQSSPCWHCTIYLVSQMACLLNTLAVCAHMKTGGEVAADGGSGGGGCQHHVEHEPLPADVAGTGMN